MIYLKEPYTYSSKEAFFEGFQRKKTGHPKKDPESLDFPIATVEA